MRHLHLAQCCTKRHYHSASPIAIAPLSPFAFALLAIHCLMSALSFCFVLIALLNVCTAQPTEKYFFERYTTAVRIARVRFACTRFLSSASTALALLPSSVWLNKKKKTFFRLAWLTPQVFYEKKNQKKKKILIFF